MMEPAPPERQHWLVAQWRRGLNTEQFHKAVQDIAQGWRLHTLWVAMGLQDVRRRYRRSFLGPFWLTLSMGILVGALGVLYGGIFKQELHDYMPFLALGFIVWGLISQLIMDGCSAFISSEGLIRQLSAPLSVYVYRSVWGNLIIFAHNFVIYVIVALWFQIHPGWAAWLAIPGLIVILLNGVWIGLWLGLLSARFRDIPQIVGSIVQVMFFMTPIIWKPDMLPERMLVVDLNPFYHLVKIVRGPLLGEFPPPDTWLAVLLITAVGWTMTLLFYTTYRWRIAYWV